jgi:16S rRNA (guanine966-N2)-methyltransferase
MRIIGGQYRGKKLISPKSDAVRPTSDQSREAVFNILSSKLPRPWEEIVLLDVFCGTGAFGLEAISRGAKHVTMIDTDTSAAIKNLNLFPKEKNKIKIIKADAAKLPVSDRKYNLVFLDAPYNQGVSKKAVDSLYKKGWFGTDCFCIVELAKTEAFTIPSEFEKIDERVYGITKFIFFKICARQFD